MAQMTEMETNRLLLRPLHLSDAARTQELFPHWEIVRFLSAVVPWPYPDDGALTHYRDVALPAMERGDEWHWTLRLKDGPAEHTGAIGLFGRSEVDNRGFWLGLPWHRQGLMMEAVVAVTDFWFAELRRDVLRTSKAAANAGSVRISEKTGMRLVGSGERQYVSGRLPSQSWELTADEWRGRRDSLCAAVGLQR